MGIVNISKAPKVNRPASLCKFSCGSCIKAMKIGRRSKRNIISGVVMKPKIAHKPLNMIKRFAN